MTNIGSLAKKFIFSDKNFYKKLGTIALPIIVQNFISSSLNTVDTVMIGQVGEAQIAAVGIANQYFILVFLVLMGIHSGCSVFISQFWGKGDKNNIRRILGLGIIASSAAMLLFTAAALLFPEGIISIFSTDPLVISEGAAYLRIVCLSYVPTAIYMGYATASRSIGNALMPMLISALSLACNTVFNYALIFGHFGAPELGVRGAAIATVAARIIEMVLVIVLVYTRMDNIAVKLHDMKGITGEFCARIFKTVLPVVMNEACWALGFVVYSVAYGRIGTQAIAAVHITGTVNNLFSVAAFGLANAAAVMVGHRIGEGNETEGRNYAWRFTALSLVVGILTGGFLAGAAPLILRFFSVSDAVHRSAMIILFITAGIMILRVFNIVMIVGVLRGAGDARYAFIAEGITMWFIGVPLAFAGAFLFRLPVYGVVALVMVEEVAKFTAIMIRLVSNKWIKNVVHEIEPVQAA